MQTGKEQLGIPSEHPNDEADGLPQANDELMRARNVAIDLLADIEDILLHQNPLIAAEWQVVVGVWENRLLEAQIAARRAKRKCSLLQARVNAGDRVDDDVVEQIEQQLDKELREWADQLAAAVEAYQQAVATQVAVIRINEETAGKLKELFRMLAKRLHPDLHPGHDESSRNMFELAKLAYSQGDIGVLSSLEISTRGLEKDAGLCSTAIEAQAELALVEAQIRELEERRDAIKSEKPYCLRALLRDKAWLENRIAQIQEEIASCENIEQGYCQRCRELGG